MVVLAAATAWILRDWSAGRAVYAIGSNADAARLAGIDTALYRCVIFGAGGALTGIGALLNAVRFNQIPSNGGIGLEMKVVAARAIVMPIAAVRFPARAVEGELNCLSPKMKRTAAMM